MYPVIALFVLPTTLLGAAIVLLLCVDPSGFGEKAALRGNTMVAVAVLLPLGAAAGVAMFVGSRWSWFAVQIYVLCMAYSVVRGYLVHGLNVSPGQLIVLAIHLVAMAYLYLPKPRLFLGISGMAAAISPAILIIASAALYHGLTWIIPLYNHWSR